jgi:hypothetical protein
MANQDKSEFFTVDTSNAEALRSSAAAVNGKHTGEPTRKRGRPRKSVEANPSPEPEQTATDSSPYIDPELVREGFKGIIRAIDSYVGMKFFHLAEAATKGDREIAERFRAEASVSPELVEAYGEAAVGVIKKYGFLMEYAPEGLMLSCILTDSTIKLNTYKKLKELCAFCSAADNAKQAKAVVPN